MDDNSTVRRITKRSVKGFISFLNKLGTETKLHSCNLKDIFKDLGILRKGY